MPLGIYLEADVSHSAILKSASASALSAALEVGRILGLNADGITDLVNNEQPTDERKADRELMLYVLRLAACGHARSKAQRKALADGTYQMISA